MKILDVEQGSLEWMQGRIGRPTASRFDAIMTPTKLKAAKTNYHSELVAEYILQQPIEWGSNAWTNRGTDEEKDARRYYAIREDVDVEQVGIVLSDDELSGGSPDGLVGNNGGLEIKVFGAIKHMQHVLGRESDPIGQVQGLIRLTEREWWDILYYNVSLPKRINRIYRDDKWQAAFGPILDDFLEKLEADKERMAMHRIPRPWHNAEQAAMAASEASRTMGAPLGI